MAAQKQQVRALTSFVARVKLKAGGETDVLVREGQVFDADDPYVVNGREALFTPVVDLPVIREAK